jgi:CheY-like chemotaxis protein
LQNLILAAVDDIFFAAKIRAAATHLNLPLRITKSGAEALEVAGAEKPAVVIVDLQSEKLDAFSFATDLRNMPYGTSFRLIGFYSHVYKELPARAEAAGYDEAVPRSVFSRRIEEFLKAT